MGVSRHFNRKRARGEKLQERHGELFEACDEEDIVINREPKRNRKGQEEEQELSPNSSRELNLKGASNRSKVAHNKHSANGHFLNPHNRLNKQCLNPGGSKNGQQPNSKTSKQEQNRKPENCKKSQCFSTKSSKKSHEGDYDNKTVCAGGMPYDTSEQDIMSFFKECGTVARIVCMKFADTQRFKGLAFVTFETETAALKALSLDGANIGDRLIKVEKARAGAKALRAPPKREAGSLSVYVGNLDWNVKKIDMKRFFKRCDIDDVRLAVDKNTGDFRGYGHIDFSDERSLEKAIKMDQKQLLGRPVKVSYAVPKGFKGKSN